LTVIDAVAALKAPGPAQLYTYGVVPPVGFAVNVWVSVEQIVEEAGVTLHVGELVAVTLMVLGFVLFLNPQPLLVVELVTVIVLADASGVVGALMVHVAVKLAPAARLGLDCGLLPEAMLYPVGRVPNARLT
jgi:hypothetical protein